MRFLTVAAMLLLAAPGFAMAQSYQIQPGDRIEITVLEDAGLNRTVLVRPDGRISLPLAGTLDVQGLSPEDVAARVRRALARDFIEPPNVTVSLSALGALSAQGEAIELQTFYVLGEVARPGAYETERPVDVIQALALAGGPGPFAAKQRIQVRRRAADRSESVRFFDFDQVEDGVVPTADIMLSDGDVIVVPERGLFE